VYSQRAKLYVYAETLLNAGTGQKEWKERGIGNIRLLRHKEHGRIRVVMRQERTHKIIVNHALLHGLKLVPHAASDRSVCWRAEDFSDLETLQETDFCLRFGSTEILDAFRDTFEKYQREMKDLYEGLDNAAAQDAGDEAAEALGGLSVAAGGGKENHPSAGDA
jgi:Ran-binding protein 1